MSTVLLSDVEKSFAGTRVLQSISFEVRDGEMVSLLGPSGCGKSTTLRCIAGFEEIDGGTISIDGSVVSSADGTVPPERRHLGIIFQSYAVWPHMTVFENVAFGLRTKRLAKRKIEERVAAVLELVGLEGLASRNSSALSGGQQQRVAIARSLVVEPAVLLFDEPLSNLDAKLRDRMRGEIRAIQQRVGITAIYVTHDQIEALTMSDRIMLMEGGEIVESGTPRELFNRPKTEFAARFLGLANIWKTDGKSGGAHALTLENGLPLLSSQPVSGASSVMVRPSSIELELGSAVSEASVEGAATRWPARIERCSFLGETTEVLCEARGLQVLVTALTHMLPDEPRQGDPCSLSFDAAQVRILGEQGEPSLKAKDAMPADVQ